MNYEFRTGLISNHIPYSPMAMGHRWIPKRLKLLGLKQADLARAIDQPDSRISEIVKGTRNVTPTEILIFSAVLKMTVEDVVNRLAFVKVDRSEASREERIWASFYHRIPEAERNDFMAAMQDQAHDRRRPNPPKYTGPERRREVA